MDTDYLSNETYEGAILAAERYHHYLALEFGVLSSDCSDEKEYLENALELIQEIKEMNEYELEDIFAEKISDISLLHKTLDNMVKNINSIKKIPVSKRHFEFE